MPGERRRQGQRRGGSVHGLIERIRGIIREWEKGEVSYPAIDSGYAFGDRRRYQQKSEVEGILGRLEERFLTQASLLRAHLERSEWEQCGILLDQMAASAPARSPAPFTGVPQDIREEVLADFAEMERCMASRCHRSAMILCGRVLEICLHRKYYEVTGQDILETQPGIGLGKLIARLKEKEVMFDPGVTEQIHLINAMRVSSVHKRQEAFLPSKGQAEAAVLYTRDIVERLFRRRQP